MKAIDRFARCPSRTFSRPLRRRSPRQLRLSRRLPRFRAEGSENLDLYTLREQLDAAVACEDYATAAALRDAISDRLLDVRVAVELANRQFYEAFERTDLDGMRALWSNGDHVQCIHPISSCIGSYELVMDSWSTVFSTITKGDFRISLEDVRTCVSDRMAYVTCTEIVSTARDVGRIQATNVFENVDGKWMIIHHHASPQRAI